MKVLFHVKGMEAKHMTWLKKSEPTEAWEIEDEEKPALVAEWVTRVVYA